MEKTIDVIVDGGKATAGPPLGPALGPMGINAGQVVAKINEATKAFSGMKVPVKVIVDTTTKQFNIEIGTPPTAELIKKEAGIEKGAGNRELRLETCLWKSLLRYQGQRATQWEKRLRTLQKRLSEAVSASE